jgi:hypothetical protein
MNAKLNTCAIALKPPFFSSGTSAELHRYFEPEFVPRFQKDLHRRLINTESQAQWKDSDRFSRHDNSVVLRLPMHKSFYLVSCEVSCDRLGFPALDPQKIVSAGFVIRRQGSDGELGWMLEDDEALGWEPVPTGLRDPDVRRRLKCSAIGQKNGPAADTIPTYTGEQTHPLHPVKAYDEKGKCHTVLYGYLPLGGTYIPRDAGSASNFDEASLEDFKTIMSEQLPWPYGYRPPLNKQWHQQHTRPVQGGRPTQAFFELLKALVETYHLGENSVRDNQALQHWADNIYFYREASSASLSPSSYSDATRQQYSAARRYSLGSWLSRHFSREDNPLVKWLAEQEVRLDNHSSGSFTFDRLPPRTGGGNLSHSLYMTASDAQELRALLDQRALDQVSASASDMPRPKFRQGPDDVYQVVPFVRVRNDDGSECCVWASDLARTETFRVAAPFDPHASRPSMIQMPSLRDLKSGLAKGVGMVTPPDTFGLLKALKLKKGASEDLLPDEPPTGAGIQWILSFSLPVVTLVAMILLMVMISLLNIVFFWLPWVKVWIPFPGSKK